MSKTSILAAVAAFLGLSLVACGGHSHDDNTLVGPKTNAVCPTTQTLTYENFGRAFLQTYCLRCHSQGVTGAARNGAPSDHNFDVLLDVRALAGHMDQKAGSGPSATNTSMPPSDPKPTVEDRKKLSEWLACGAP